MPASPPITYFLYDLKHSVAADHPHWKLPLPLDRNASRRNRLSKSRRSVSYGDYFEAVTAFLKKNHCKLLCRAISRQIGRDIKVDDIRHIRVCIEKHGAFYHPARIDVTGGGFRTKFVLNVAVSRAGRDGIRNDYHNMHTLKRVIREPFLPRVYGKDDIALDNGCKLAMFLGQWFDGYHEFHLSRDPCDNTLKIRVWDPRRQDLYLSPHQWREVCRQAARILTCCYNAETTEHIAGWHHAAGDFIVRLADSSIDVKLITVRRYRAVLKTGDRHAASLLNGLLVFFINLTIRMRLDRLDGTGELVWSDDGAVAGCVLGFLEALARKPVIDALPGPIDACFMSHFLNHTPSELLGIARAASDALFLQAAEVSFISKHLPEHLAVLLQVIGEFGGPSVLQM